MALKQHLASLLRDPQVAAVIYVAEDGKTRTLATRRLRPTQAVATAVFTGRGVPA